MTTSQPLSSFHGVISENIIFISGYFTRRLCMIWVILLNTSMPPISPISLTPVLTRMWCRVLISVSFMNFSTSFIVEQVLRPEFRMVHNFLQLIYLKFESIHINKSSSFLAEACVRFVFVCSVQNLMISDSNLLIFGWFSTSMFFLASQRFVNSFHLFPSLVMSELSFSNLSSINFIALWFNMFSSFDLLFACSSSLNTLYSSITFLISTLLLLLFVKYFTLFNHILNFLFSCINFCFQIPYLVYVSSNGFVTINKVIQSAGNVRSIFSHFFLLYPLCFFHLRYVLHYTLLSLLQRWFP